MLWISFAQYLEESLSSPKAFFNRSSDFVCFFKFDAFLICHLKVFNHLSK